MARTLVANLVQKLVLDRVLVPRAQRDTLQSTPASGAAVNVMPTRSTNRDANRPARGWELPLRHLDIVCLITPPQEPSGPFIERSTTAKHSGDSPNAYDWRIRLFDQPLV